MRDDVARAAALRALEIAREAKAMKSEKGDKGDPGEIQVLNVPVPAGKVQVSGDEYVAGADRAALYAIIKLRPEFEGAQDA